MSVVCGRPPVHAVPPWVDAIESLLRARGLVRVPGEPPRDRCVWIGFGCCSCKRASRHAARRRTQIHGIADVAADIAELLGADRFWCCVEDECPLTCASTGTCAVRVAWTRPLYASDDAISADVWRTINSRAA